MRAYYANVKDTIISRPIYKRDSTEVLFSEIIHLKTDWVRTPSLAGFTALIVIGAILSIPALPIMAIANGANGVEEWEEGPGILVGLAVPIVTLSLIQKNYDTDSDWEITVE